MSTSSNDTSNICVINSLHKTTRVIDRIYAAELRKADLGLAQFSILQALAQQQAISVSALAAAMQVDRTTLSRNLKPLEKQGLIQRNVCPDDARQASLRLATSGRTKLRAARRHWHTAQSKVVTLFGAGRWQQLANELSALRGIESR